jgi:hypothetical protein
VTPLLTTPYLPVSIMSATPDKRESLRAAKAVSQYRYCNTCTHVYNAVFDDRLVDYTRTGCRMFNNGASWVRHIEDLQNYISGHDYPRIVEIGPGDGSFLSGVSCGEKVVFEPSADALKCTEMGFTVTVDYFNPAIDVAPFSDKSTLFLMRHVLEHIETPRRFVEDITREWVGGPVDMIVEVPNITNALTHTRIEDWVYEHCQHFTPSSLKRLFTSLGWTIKRLETKYNNEVIVLHARYLEDRFEKYTKDACAAFSKSYAAGVFVAREKLAKLIGSGKSIAYWGGIGKSAMFLHQIAVPPMRVVDSDGKKTGLCVPGLDVQIEHCTSLLDRPVDVIVVTTAWRASDIAAEITRRGIQCESLLMFKQGELVEVPIG